MRDSELDLTLFCNLYGEIISFITECKHNKADNTFANLLAFTLLSTQSNDQAFHFVSNFINLIYFGITYFIYLL